MKPMNKKAKKYDWFLVVLIWWLVFVFVGCGIAQINDQSNIDIVSKTEEMSLLNIVGSELVSLSITPFLEIGNMPVFSSDDSTYAQYTSTVSGAATRKITVQITDGEVPTGCRLKLDASGIEDVAGEGVPVDGGVTIPPASGEAVTIINGIKSCATGTGATDGAKLTYSLEIDNFSEVKAGTYNFTVSLTFTPSS